MRVGDCAIPHCMLGFAGHVEVNLPVDEDRRPSTPIDMASRPTAGWLLVVLPLCQRHLDLLGVDSLAAAIPHRLVGGSPENVGMSPDRSEAAGIAKAPPSPPKLGEEVLYHSRTGDYWLAAKVCRTVHSSSPEAVERAQVQGRFFIQPLGLFQVDLTVFTPGGSYVEGDPSQWTGTYAEHHISYDPDGAPGTWCRFEDVWVRGIRL